MSDLVPPEVIESIVGVSRHPTMHIGRMVSVEEVVYILHSQQCKDSGIDLRECEFSLALDRGIDPSQWTGYEDRPVGLGVVEDRLMPFIPLTGILSNPLWEIGQ